MRHDKRYNGMQDNAEKMEKALKKLARLVAHIDRLRIERNRMIKKQQPPKIKDDLKITSEEYHKICEQDFSDVIGF